MKTQELCRIDKEIKRLLFANPSLDIDVCKGIMGNLDNRQVKKEKVRLWLEENIIVYKNKAKGVETPSLYRKLCQEAKDHISMWEDVFGKAELDDLLYMVESTDLKVTDIGWDYISPSSISKMLDNYIVAQEEYKDALGLTVYMHLMKGHDPNMSLPKSNLLVYGPSGVGKTSGVKVLADRMNIRVGIVNCNSLVQEGYVGPKVTDVFTSILADKHDDMILICDEFDKLLFKYGFYGQGVMQELLNILDDDNVISFATEFGQVRQFRQISSRNITCILCGKFDSLQSVVKSRLIPPRVGFCSSEKEVISNDIYKYVTLSDIKKVLRSDELCGRIGQYVRVTNLTADNLVSIMLHARNSVYEKYQTFFSAHQISLSMDEEAAREIADYVLREYKDLGVRGLDAVLRQVLRQELMEVGQMQGQSIEVTKKFVTSRLNINETT